MTKKEAATALQQGKKVQHSSFRSTEFIYQKECKIYDETEKDVTADFEVSGGYPMFDNGWRIYGT